METEDLHEIPLNGKTIERTEYRTIYFTDGTSLETNATVDYGSAIITFEY